MNGMTGSIRKGLKYIQFILFDNIINLRYKFLKGSSPRMKKNKKERRSNFGNFFRNNKFVLCLPGYDRVGAGLSVKRRNTIAKFLTI